jgi:hypothetical protein
LSLKRLYETGLGNAPKGVGSQGLILKLPADQMGAVREAIELAMDQSFPDARKRLLQAAHGTIVDLIERSMAFDQKAGKKGLTAYPPSTVPGDDLDDDDGHY